MNSAGRIRGLRAVAAAGALCVAMSTAATAQASTTEFSQWCTPVDNGLSELSGLSWPGGHGYAIGDHGSDDRLATLDRSCAVIEWTTVGVDTIDVEDLAVDSGGTVWLADTGDNDRDRDSVSLIGVEMNSDRRDQISLRYPDGPHDVEAFALTPDGYGVLVTKVKDERAQVYTTPQSLSSLDRSSVTTVELVGTVSAQGVDGTVRPITGAAVSADGTIAALRTKKDIFLYSVTDGAVAEAFIGPPTQVLQAPDQPQGEALAFTSDGDLLIGSEAGGAKSADADLPPLLVLKDGVEDESSLHWPSPVQLSYLGAVVGVAAAGWWWATRRRNRNH